MEVEVVGTHYDEGWALHTPPVSDFGWNPPPTPMSPLPAHPDENGDPIPSGNRGGGDQGHGDTNAKEVLYMKCVMTLCGKHALEWDIPETASVTEGEWSSEENLLMHLLHQVGEETGPITPPR